jgi:hypothetical protein
MEDGNLGPTYSQRRRIPFDWLTKPEKIFLIYGEPFFCPR